MKKTLFLTFPLIIFYISNCWAGDGVPTPKSNSVAIDLVQTHADYVWTLVAACLVFFMQAGFAMVEAGFTRAKNAVNIMMKNLMDFSVGTIGFFVVGFGLMFGQNDSGWIGTSLFGLSGVGDNTQVFTFLIFQTVFAATAA